MACQPNPVLNALLLQLFLTYLQPQLMQQTALLNHGQQVQPAALEPAPFNFNQLAPVGPRYTTTLVTSTLVTNVTTTLSKVVSVRFRNQRIPTTVFTKTVVQVTETVTATETLALEPTLLAGRRRRRDAVEIESSMASLHDADVDESRLLTHVSVVAVAPRVQQAWNRFVSVLEQEAMERV